jgi:hypothetical protein
MEQSSLRGIIDQIQVLWYPSSATPASQCTCLQGKTHHIELSQTVLPTRMREKSKWPRSPLLESAGAIVLGYNKDAGWIWDDFGEPEKGDLPVSDDDSDKEAILDS